MPGMIVPAHWAEARLQERHGKRQVTVRRWGWSDEGPEQAEAHAEQRVREAMQRLREGKAEARRERKVAYNGADGVPIREEIVSRHGDAVVTRNGYGALCLNTPDVLFADVDFGPPRLSGGVMALVAVVVGIAAGIRHGFSNGVLALGGAVVLQVVGVLMLDRLATVLSGGAEARALGRVRRFVEGRKGWRVRVYRTPAGLRVLAMHRRFDPVSPEVADFFKALRSDRLYVKMCRRQRCFRARLTPKPWRIGIGGRIRPRPGVWPVDPKWKPERDRWIAAYEQASAGYASCRYLASFGKGLEDPAAESVRLLHDAQSRAASSLPLA